MKGISIIREPAPKPGILKRPDLYAIALGQVIGAGIITTIGPAIGMTGYSAWLAYAAAIVAGLIFIAPWLFVSSTLRMSGGQYSMVASLAGPRLAGMVAVGTIPQLMYLALFGTSLGIYINSLVPAIPAQWGGIVAFSLIFLINMFGITTMAKVQKIMTWALIGTLLLFMIVGLFNLKQPVLDVSQPGFVSNGLTGFLAAMFILYYSCTGYAVLPMFGRDANNARRDIPWAMFATFLSIIVLYVGVAIVNAGVLPLADVAYKPLTGVASAIFPPWLFYIFIFGGPILALATTINSTFAAYPYIFAQASRDGWLPQWLQKRNKFGAQWIILVAAFVIGLIPQLLNFNILTIIATLMLFVSVISFFSIIAFYNLPKKYPEAWKKARLHVPNWLYYVIVTASALVTLYVFYRSLTTLSLTTAIVSSAAMVISIVYAWLRSKTGKVQVRTSVWTEDDEAEAIGEQTA